MSKDNDYIITDWQKRESQVGEVYTRIVGRNFEITMLIPLEQQFSYKVPSYKEFVPEGFLEKPLYVDIDEAVVWMEISQGKGKGHDQHFLKKRMVIAPKLDKKCTCDNLELGDIKYENH